MRYEPIPELSIPAIEAAIARDQPEELRRVVLAAALYAGDGAWAESVCLTLSHHLDAAVRDNAVLGFGHIARIHRTLDQSKVVPIVEMALRDADPGVRGQAEAAADDIEHFLGWRLARR